MYEEKFTGLNCTETVKIVKDKGDVDETTHKATFVKDDGENKIKIVISSTLPLKAQQGETVDFGKTNPQTNLMDFKKVDELPEENNINNKESDEDVEKRKAKELADKIATDEVTEPEVEE